MRLFASPIGIWSAVLVGIAATAVFGQSFVVFTGTAAYLSLPADLVRFALDSPLEEAGFELSVPPERKAALDRVRRPSVIRRQA